MSTDNIFFISLPSNVPVFCFFFVKCINRTSKNLLLPQKKISVITSLLTKSGNDAKAPSTKKKYNYNLTFGRSDAVKIGTSFMEFLQCEISKMYIHMQYANK